MAVTEAAPNEFPFLVDISTGSTMAQGILISPEWVLTTAELLLGSSSVTVVAGAHTNYSFVTLEGDPSPQQTTAHEFYLHGSWDRSTFAHNIALIRLANPLTPNAGVQPISVLSAAGNTPDLAVTCVGRGMAIEVNHVTPRPQVVDARVVPISVATAFFGASHALTHQVVVDLQGAPIRTAALITRGAEGSQLMGLFNYGGTTIGGPAVYHFIADYADWIMSNSGVNLS